MICLCSKNCCCHDAKSDQLKFSGNDLKDRNLPENRDEPIGQHRGVMDETIKHISANRGFRRMIHSVATYEKTNKGLSNVYPKCFVQSHGVHRAPINL